MAKESSREENTEARNRAIFRRYTRIIKQKREKYGDAFRHIPLISLYTETAIPFFISAQVVGRVIREKLKEGYRFTEGDVRNIDIDESIDDIVEHEED